MWRASSLPRVRLHPPPRPGTTGARASRSKKTVVFSNPASRPWCARLLALVSVRKTRSRKQSTTYALPAGMLNPLKALRTPHEDWVCPAEHQGPSAACRDTAVVGGSAVQWTDFTGTSVVISHCGSKRMLSGRTLNVIGSLQIGLEPSSASRDLLLERVRNHCPPTCSCSHGWIIATPLTLSHCASR